MSEYLNFPEYQENDNNKFFAGTESQILNELNNFQNPSLKASELYYDQKNLIVKPQQFAKPKYIKEKEVYQVLKPVTKEVVQLPVKYKNKVKTAKTVYNKPIVVNGVDELNQILDHDTFLQQAETPIPTTSVIQNLCKESVIGSSSSYYSPQVVLPNQNQNYNQSKIDSKLLDQNIYESKIKIHPEMIEYQSPNINQNISQHYSAEANNNNIMYHTSNPNANANLSMGKEYQQSQHVKTKMTQSNNIKHDFQMSKASNMPHYQSTTNNYINNNVINNDNINNIDNDYQMAKVQKLPSKNKNNNYPVLNVQKIQKVPNINDKYQQSKIQMSKIPYKNIGMDPKQSNNKNYIQKYFHEDDIPDPIVCEGESIKESNIKIKDTDMKLDNKEEHSSHINENIKDINNNKSNNKNVQKQANSLLEEIPVDKTQIMSQQPSIDMSGQNSNIFQKSGNQSTLLNQQTNNESKIEKQSKVYQIYPNTSQNPNNIKQPKESYQSFKQSNLPIQSNLANQINNQSDLSYNPNIKVEKITRHKNTQKSNMTFQQPYQQSMNLEKPPVYKSDAIKYNMVKDNKPVPESIKVVKLTSPTSSNANIKQTNSRELQFSHDSKLNNQSSIYQQSYKQSNINNLNNKESLKQNPAYNSKVQPIMQQPNINTNYIDTSLQGSNIQQSKLMQSGLKQPNSRTEKNNYKADRSSFPTASFAGNTLMNSKITLPSNPFGVDNNSIKKSDVPFPEENMTDSHME
jgi:hypothetical protein